MNAKTSKLVTLLSMLKLLSNGKDLHGFIVDRGTIYDKLYTNKERDRFKIVNAFGIDLLQVNKRFKNDKHFIRTGKGYVQTSIPEYKQSTVGGHSYAVEKKTKNFIIVYTFPFGEDKNFVKKIQVYSRKNGKLLLNLMSKATGKNFKDSIRRGIKYIEKEKVIQEVLYDNKKHDLTVNIYDLKGDAIDKKTYSVNFDVDYTADKKVVVYYPKEGDNVYCIYRDKIKGTAHLYIASGSKFEKVELNKASMDAINSRNTGGTKYDDFCILHFYNPDAKKLEYYVQINNEAFVTNNFLLKILENDILSYVPYKDYTAVVTPDSKNNGVSFTLYSGTKELIKFNETQTEYLLFKHTRLYRKGKYLYIAMIYSNRINLYKYVQKGTGIDKSFDRASANSYSLKDNCNVQTADSLISKMEISREERELLSRRNAGSGVADLLQKEFKRLYNPSRRLQYKHLFYTINETDRIGYRNYNLFEVEKFRIADIRKNRFNYHRMRVINDNAFIINNILLVIDKNNNLIASRNFHICCNKALFTVRFPNSVIYASTHRIYSFDFKNRIVNYINCRTDDIGWDNVLIKPVNDNSTVYVVVKSNYSDFRMSVLGEDGFKDVKRDTTMALFKIDMRKEKVSANSFAVFKNGVEIGDKLASLQNKLYSNKGRFIVFRKSLYTDDINNILYFIDINNSKLYNINNIVSFSSLKDLKSLTQEYNVIRRAKDNAGYER
jgi:hypothetical protein